MNPNSTQKIWGTAAIAAPLALAAKLSLNAVLGLKLGLGDLMVETFLIVLATVAVVSSGSGREKVASWEFPLAFGLLPIAPPVLVIQEHPERFDTLFTWILLQTPICMAAGQLGQTLSPGLFGVLHRKA